MRWQVKKLGDVCNIIGGGTPSKSNDSFYEGEIPWATVRDMKNERLSSTELCITGEAIKQSSTNLIPSGAIITATRVGLGKVCILEQDTAINQDLKAVIPKTKELDNLFLFWWMKSIAHLIVGAGTGATVQGVKLTFVKALEVPLPPIPEQKRIVALLDTVFADLEQTRAKTEQNLKNARELSDSYLQQIFSQKDEGWVDLPLGDICNFKHGFAFKSEFFVDHSDLVLLTPGNFYEDGGYRDRGEKQKHYQGDFPNEYLLPKGSLLVAMTEQAAGLLGSSALVPEDNIFLHNQRLGLVEINSEFEGKVSLNFLFHLFNTKYFRAKVQETASGLKVRHTSPKKMQVIPVPLLLDLTEQENIAQKLFEAKKRVMELEAIYQQKLDSIDELKKSILQKAFNGELTNAVE